VGVGRRWVADADAELVERPKDVSVTAQESRDEDAQQDHYERDHDNQGNHCASFSTS
jgi:hypothetical protein